MKNQEAMTAEERDRWKRFNGGLHLCMHNAENYKNITNIILEVSNLLYAFAEPGMLDFETVHKVDVAICRHMKSLNDPIYKVENI